MALWFQLMVNDEHIGTCEIQRMEDFKGRTFEHVYKVRLDGYVTCVKHRYDDGAWALVRRALEAVETAKRHDPAVPPTDEERSQ